jgi:hypothetical protein
LSVIPANAGIQTEQWMPDQVRHDAFASLIAGMIKMVGKAWRAGNYLRGIEIPVFNRHIERQESRP